MEWFESLDGSLDIEAEPLLGVAMEAAKAINACLRFLYSHDAWLSPQEASYAAELAMRFLRRCQTCACRAWEEGRALFVLQPKLHALHEMTLQLLDSAASQQLSLNPLLFSNQCNEDFIGRQARLSRRVAAKRVIQRVLQRYLKGAYAQWVSAGFLVEGSR